jgi:hypothetical protein
MTLTLASSFFFLPLGAPPLVWKGGSFVTLLCALCFSAHLYDNPFLSEAFLQ